MHVLYIYLFMANKTSCNMQYSYNLQEMMEKRI